MDVDARLALRSMVTRSLSHRRVQGMASAVTAITILAASITLAPPGVADSADSLRAAVTSMRSAACAPLRSEPLVEQTTADVNRSTDAWLDHTGHATPATDPVPFLKDRGYGVNKASLLQGAGVTEAKAIKGLLLQGYLDIPNCSFKDYGVSEIRNRTTNYFLVAMVLAA